MSLTKKEALSDDDLILACREMNKELAKVFLGFSKGELVVLVKSGELIVVGDDNE